jgi:hypothetical protein
LNPGRSGGKPATNHLSYGAAYQQSSYESTLVVLILTSYKNSEEEEEKEEGAYYIGEMGAIILLT